MSNRAKKRSYRLVDNQGVIARSGKDYNALLEKLEEWLQSVARDWARNCTVEIIDFDIEASRQTLH